TKATLEQGGGNKNQPAPPGALPGPLTYSHPVSILLYMITELLGHKDYLCILLALRKRKGLRFSEIQKELELKPAQVDRALKFLRAGLWVIPRIIPAKGGRILVEYELSKRGECFLAVVVDSLRNAVNKNVAILGSSARQEVQSLYL
ncbi:MAG: hypothetical protein AABZ68_04340, partial [Candidatus Deferrimicrobiota bacterium]